MKFQHKSTEAPVITEFTEPNSIKLYYFKKPSYLKIGKIIYGEETQTKSALMNYLNVSEFIIEVESFNTKEDCFNTFYRDVIKNPFTKKLIT